MGQQLFKVDFGIVKLTKTDGTTLNSDLIFSDSDKDDLSFFFPLKSDGTATSPSESDIDHRSSRSQTLFIKQIQNHLSLLTNSAELKQIDIEINKILTDDVLPYVTNCYERVMKEIRDRLEKQHRLQTTLANKLKEDQDENLSIFEQPLVDFFSENTSSAEADSDRDKQLKFVQENQRKTRFESEQFSYFAVESLISILLLLIKSAEKNDLTIIHQILTLASRLCEQIPMKRLSSSNNSRFLFKSLKPLFAYIHDLSLTKDPMVAQPALRILLNFSIARGSFQDILPLLCRLVLDTNDVYDVRRLFIQLNNGLTETLRQCKKQKQQTAIEGQNDSDSSFGQAEDDDTISKETTDSIPLEYLKSIGAYPNTRLMDLDAKLFTGQFLSSVILAHIDFDNEIYSTKQFERNSLDGSFSFEFHPNTFKQLFDLIEQLTNHHSNTIVDYMLTVCLRLFTTHLTFLCAIQSNLHRDLLGTNEQITKTVRASAIDLTRFATDDELKQWCQFLIHLVSHRDFQSEQTTLSEEASKAIVCLIEKQTSSFTAKLSFLHKSIIEDRHPTLIRQCLILLKKKETLLSWIEVLCDNDENQFDKTMAFKILFSFVDICCHSTTNIDEIQKMLLAWQELLFSRLVSLSSNETTDGLQSSPTNLNSLVIRYVTHLFNYWIYSPTILADLVDSILVGLCLMTKTEPIFPFATVEPIFAAVLPQMAEAILQNADDGNHHQRLIYWLLGKMSQVMMNGLPLDSFELKHLDKLNSILFAGGCERLTTDQSQHLSDLLKSNLALYSHCQLTNEPQESSSDKEFLMSLYDNTGEGAQLISKMKMFVKEKQRFLQNSIEQQANDACAAVFAVYIKHFRRINLGRNELSRTDHGVPHSKLLSIYDYANHVRTLFATIKAQGDDCNQFHDQIKIKSRFLLLSVKETNFIPIIENDSFQSSSTHIHSQQTNPIFEFQRQISRWTKAKHILRLLRNTMQACIRFKRIMLEKKQNLEQKFDGESTFHRAIDAILYGDCSKTIIEQTQFEPDELDQCLCRQYQRATTRLITYRFIETFIHNVCQLKNQNRIEMILSICLSHLRNPNLEWSILENIQATQFQLKGLIRTSFFSMLKTILSVLVQSTTFQSEIVVQNLFYLLNFDYQSADICLLHNERFAQTLFHMFLVTSIEQSNRIISLKTKLITFNWFRSFVNRLCENIQLERLKGTPPNQLLLQQRELLFNTLILNELKSFNRNRLIRTEDKEVAQSPIEYKTDSLKDASIAWFLQATKVDASGNSNKFEIDLRTNQYLLLLLRCVHFYEHCRSACATVDYIQELLDIYYHSQYQITLLLVLKLLRQILSIVPETADGKSRILIEKLLADMLISIGESFTSQRIASEIVTELIFIYRTVMSRKSPWQMIATQFVFDSIKSDFELKSLHTNQINKLRASLCVLGGFIQPFGLASIVKVSNDEDQLGIITEIDEHSDGAPYRIEYLQTNQTESVGIDRLRLEIDVPPPDLLLLSSENNSNANIHSVLDALGSFIQTNPSTNDSLLLLELKRRSIAVLYHILNNQKLVEIFLQKPYASIMAKLSMSQSRSPTDLHLFDKQHLEQYSLSLDKCQQFKDIRENDETQIPDDKKNFSDVPTDRDQLIVDVLSTPASKSNGWKPYASEIGIELFKTGRTGDDQISIVPFPRDSVDIRVFEECGTNHRFKGRIHLTRDNVHVSFPTFIVDNLQLSEGKWYFCVKLLVAGVVQIGWATKGFTPRADHGDGIGDDRYSWSYDGSRAVFFHDRAFPDQFNNLRWKKNDVCGCGIDIDGENTNINYWLNGKLLGTAFKHQANIPLSSIKCNLLPNGPNTSYFPGVTLGTSGHLPSSCELIFSPEDMQQCPLPNGYKPLVLPKLIHTENSIVCYPFSAYLIGDNIEDYFYTTRTTTSNIFLRDFVNDHHVKTDFTLEGHQLILPENGVGFPFSIGKDASSITITFDFQILTSAENELNQQRHIPLLTFDTTKASPIHISLKKFDQRIRTVIIFDRKGRQTRIFIDNECRTFDIPFESEIINLHLLPEIGAGITNLAIWKSALSEEQIRRLFTFGLFYVAVDYHQLKEYRKRANTFTFTKHQQQFPNEFVVLMDESFEDNSWEKKKKQADHHEVKYFHAIDGTDRSTVELFGNKTYLVLDKSSDKWMEYSLVLDISIPACPIENEHLTLLTFNDKSQLFISHEGKLCLDTDGLTKQSHSILSLDEDFRLFISVRERNIQISVNGSLEIDVEVEDNRFEANSNRIDLFRELDLTRNATAEDKVRLRCQSITFLNRSTPITDIENPIKLPNTSLESFVAPPLSMIIPSLIAIGHKQKWIETVIKQYNTTNIEMIDRILREQKEQFLKADLQDEHKRYLTILLRLGPSIDKEKLDKLIDFSKFDTDEQVAAVGEFILTHWNDLQSLSEISETKQDSDDENKQWFDQCVRGLGIHQDVPEWIRDKSMTTKGEDGDPNTRRSGQTSRMTSDGSLLTSDIEALINGYQGRRANPFANRNHNSDIVYKLLDLTQSEETTMQSQRKSVQKSIQYSHSDISRQQYLNSRIGCEQGLAVIYARCTLVNMLKVWSNEASALFPLEKFGDCTFIVALLRLMDYHHTHHHTGENIDRMSLLIKDILKVEIQELLGHIVEHRPMNNDFLQSKAPLLCQLQKDLLVQSIRFSLKPSLLEQNCDEDTVLDEQTVIKQPNLKFIFKILSLFVGLIKDRSTIKQNQIDALVPLLFPVPLINLMFDLFLLVPMHQSKIFLLHLFAT